VFWEYFRKKPNDSGRKKDVPRSGGSVECKKRRSRGGSRDKDVTATWAAQGSAQVNEIVLIGAKEKKNRLKGGRGAMIIYER